MIRVARFTLAALMGAALVGCNDERRLVGADQRISAAGAGVPSMSRQIDETGPLVRHVVAAQATDAAISGGFGDHYVWLDPAARGNPKLFVFMPGTRNVPSSWLRLEQEAARLGYHVIGLAYQNEVEVIGVCTGSTDLDCSGKMRMEIIDGIDRSPFVNVTAANSIDNRLTKLLVYLDAQFPDEGWSRFLEDGAPKWSQIAVSGQSQGAGQAALIGKLRHVDRVVMFSGPPDARIVGEVDSWIGIGETPASKYFALFHQRDHVAAGIQQNLPAFDLLRFGEPVFAELSEPPYGGTHILTTDLRPTLGYDRPNAHQSTARDNNTPIGPDGVPLLRAAWRYLLGEPPHGGADDQ